MLALRDGPNRFSEDENRLRVDNATRGCGLQRLWRNLLYLPRTYENREPLSIFLSIFLALRPAQCEELPERC